MKSMGKGASLQQVDDGDDGDVEEQKAPKHSRLSTATEQTSNSAGKDESVATIIYENPNMMFSAIAERGFRMTLVWKPWSTRVIKVFSDGTLTNARPNRPDNIPRHHQYLLEEVEVTLIENDGADDATRGLKVKCQTMDRIETYFRLIAPADEIDRFLAVVKSVAIHHNVGSHAKTVMTVSEKKRNVLAQVFMPNNAKSAMRRAVGRAMDVHDKRSKKERILAKRCIMMYLPVIGDNDLIHGSWWFVIGSVGVTLTALVVAINEVETNPPFGTDDSELSIGTFEASWILLLLSGLFSTLGSLAFVRAFHEDPPMKPLFHGNYHLQSDELLASWLFFGACLPFVPYCLVFLSNSAYRNLIYVAALVMAILACLGSLLFVRACYPTDRTHRDLLYPLSRYLCCLCCSEKWRRHHLMNDWLGGSWLFLWGCLLGTFVCIPLFFVAVANGSSLQMFIFGTSFIESACYSIGSAYFVAGSYPEEYVVAYKQGGEALVALTAQMMNSASSGGQHQRLRSESDDDLTNVTDDSSKKNSISSSSSNQHHSTSSNSNHISSQTASQSHALRTVDNDKKSAAEQMQQLAEKKGKGDRTNLLLAADV